MEVAPPRQAVERPGLDVGDEVAHEGELGLAQGPAVVGFDPVEPRQVALTDEIADRRAFGQFDLDTVAPKG